MSDLNLQKVRTFREAYLQAYAKKTSTKVPDGTLKQTLDLSSLLISNQNLNKWNTLIKNNPALKNYWERYAIGAAKIVPEYLNQDDTPQALSPSELTHYTKAHGQKKASKFVVQLKSAVRLLKLLNQKNIPHKQLAQARTSTEAYLILSENNPKTNLPTSEIGEKGIDLLIFNNKELCEKFLASLKKNQNADLAEKWRTIIIPVLTYFQNTGNLDNNSRLLSKKEINAYAKALSHQLKNKMTAQLKKVRDKRKKNLLRKKIRGVNQQAQSIARDTVQNIKIGIALLTLYKKQIETPASVPPSLPRPPIKPTTRPTTPPTPVKQVIPTALTPSPRIGKAPDENTVFLGPLNITPNAKNFTASAVVTGILGALGVLTTAPVVLGASGATTVYFGAGWALKKTGVTKKITDRLVPDDTAATRAQTLAWHQKWTGVGTLAGAFLHGKLFSTGPTSTWGLLKEKWQNNSSVKTQKTSSSKNQTTFWSTFQQKPGTTWWGRVKTWWGTSPEIISVSQKTFEMKYDDDEQPILPKTWDKRKNKMVMVTKKLNQQTKKMEYPKMIIERTVNKQDSPKESLRKFLNNTLNQGTRL